MADKVTRKCVCGRVLAGDEVCETGECHAIAVQEELTQECGAVQTRLTEVQRQLTEARGLIERLWELRHEYLEEGYPELAGEVEVFLALPKEE